jgi:capsular polysaccharide biosynthesis protein
MSSFPQPATFPKKINFKWGYLPQKKTVIYSTKLIWLSKGCLIIYDPKLFPRTTYNKTFTIKDMKFIFHNLMKIKFNTSRKILLVTDEWSNGPYHFFVDVLSKILHLEKDLNIFEKYSVALPDSEYMRYTAVNILDKIGIKFKNIIFMKSDSLYLNVGCAKFISLTHVMGSNNPQIISSIQKRLLNHTHLYSNSADTRVYYYRKNRRRIVVNDDQVQLFLKSKGFICTDFDNLSYLDAWSLMARSKLFIGIHGGGLTNMFYMPRGATVVEFRTDNPNPESHCYWHLAYSLGHDYCHFIAKSVTPGNNTIEGSRGCDIEVNIDDLRTWFTQNNL